jgi:hypothetical protein
MSKRSAAVTLSWGDGDYVFRLGIRELHELQDKCNAGPNAIVTRIVRGDWRVEDLVETIRLGLIGGGLAPVAALKLTRLYAEDRPLMESILPAQAILMAALAGAEDDAPDIPQGNPEGAAPEA